MDKKQKNNLLFCDFWNNNGRLCRRRRRRRSRQFVNERLEAIKAIVNDGFAKKLAFKEDEKNYKRDKEITRNCLPET